MTLDSFLSHFSHIRKTPNGWQVCCLSHKNEKANLSISVEGGGSENYAN